MRSPGSTPDVLDDALHQAIDHHILEQAEGGSVTFRHSLLGETVADDLLPGARRRLHSAWLTALHAHPEVQAPGAVALHAAATGDTATATTAAVEAGDAAMQVGGARDALRLYEAALGWVDDDPGLRARISLSAAAAAEIAGEQTRSLDLLEEELADLDPREHPMLRARLLIATASWYTSLDLPGDPLALSAEAVALLPQPRDAAAVDVLVQRLDVLVALRRADEARELVEEILRLPGEDPRPGDAANPDGRDLTAAQRHRPPRRRGRGRLAAGAAGRRGAASDLRAAAAAGARRIGDRARQPLAVALTISRRTGTPSG